MSLTSSFYSALSGIDTHGTAMQAIGDNLANVHTIGFKESTVSFEDILGESLGAGSTADQIGVGAKVSTVSLNFSQGSFESTNVSTDVAINGKGFFCVGDPSSNEKWYTRAGQFIFDKNGYYVNPEGYRVQGYLYDSTGATLVENLSDIQVDQSSMTHPNVTSEVQVAVNLSASDAGQVWDPTDPSGSSSFSTPVNVYDSLGQPHLIQIYFTKSAAQTWDWHGMIDGADVQGGTPAVPEIYGGGTINFNISGGLTTPMPVSFYTGGLTFANGLSATASTVDFTGTTQLFAESTVQKLTQDGYAAGMLSDVTIDEEGNIVASFTNGTTKRVARIALADFPNINGLTRDGSTLYQATTDSGEPLYNKPGVGAVGTISSSALEGSNVDLASQFIQMIVIQRGYQANSKVISTTDEMLAQLLALK